MKITKKDIVNYLSIIRITYKDAYITKSDNDEVTLIEFWYSMFKCYDKELMDVAVMNAIRGSEFYPKPATIIAEIDKIEKAYQKSDLELWEELTSVLYEVSEKAYLTGYTYIEPNGKTQGENAKERLQAIFDSLSPEIREYVGNTKTLVNVAYTDNLTYEKSRFIKMIPEIRARQKIKKETQPLIGFIKLIDNRKDKE